MSTEMGYPQMSFLQMLNGATQSEEEKTEQEDDEEDKKQLHLEIQQRFQRESNLQRLLEIQECYNRYNPPSKIESFCPPPPPPPPPATEQQLDSCVTAVGPTKERKKRKRSRAPPPPAKDAKEAESQRMNHIAVERNRRRLMNSHLTTLCALMPASYVQRGDQASIVAGAIDFVKELEQLLLSLQAKKRIRTGGDATAATPSSVSSSSCMNEEDACHVAAGSEFFVSPQYTGYTEQRRRGGAQSGGDGADVEATVVQGHVNLKIAGPRRRGQLVRAIAALEGIGLSVLHLNVCLVDDYSILYSLNLKMEEECKLGSADEITTAVHQTFNYIISSSSCS